jgi:hypothetical protein
MLYSRQLSALAHSFNTATSYIDDVPFLEVLVSERGCRETKELSTEELRNILWDNKALVVVLHGDSFDHLPHQR